MRRNNANIREWTGLMRYALLNLCTVVMVIAALPYVAREAHEIIEQENGQQFPRLPNLVEKRLVTASVTAPTAEVLARYPVSSLPTVPLKKDVKLAVFELVSTSEQAVVPLAKGLDAAESMPVKPLRPLHEPRYQSLYADLMKRQSERRQTAAISPSSRQIREASLPSSLRKKRTLAALERDSAGAIAYRNFASLTP